MLKKILGFIAIVTMVGCVTTPVVEVSTPGSVMVKNISWNQLADALRLAESECQKYGKHAVHVPDNHRDGVASYECKQ
jgi:hypothetical protein